MYFAEFIIVALIIKPQKGQVTSRDTLPEELISSIARSNETKGTIDKMNSLIEQLQVKEAEFDEKIQSVTKLITLDQEATEKCEVEVVHLDSFFLTQNAFHHFPYQISNLCQSKTELNDPGWTALTRRIDEINKAFTDSKAPTEMIVSAAKVSIQNLETLCQGMDHVKSQLPERKVLNEEEIEAVNLVTKLVSKIAEMVNQRSNLADQLRAALASDDITGTSSD